MQFRLKCWNTRVQHVAVNQKQSGKQAPAEMWLHATNASAYYLELNRVQRFLDALMTRPTDKLMNCTDHIF